MSVAIDSNQGSAAEKAGTGIADAPSSVRPKPRIGVWPALAISVPLAAMYLPALVLTYGLKDDYTLLASAHGYAYAGPAQPAESIRLGRPLYGLLSLALNSALPNVDSLWIARALAALGVALFAVLLYRALGLLVESRAVAVAVTLFICSLPPFLICVGWATLFAMPYSAALGAVAALLAARAATGKGPLGWRWIIAGNGALLLALAIYQPTAMTFWLVALIVALSARHSPIQMSRLLHCVSWVGVPAMIGAFLILKIGVWTLGAANAQRAGLLRDIPAKIRWIPKPVGLALNLFYMPQSAVVAAIAACLVAAGALLFSRDCVGRVRLTVLALAAIAVPLSFTPSLLSDENYSTFRTLGPLTATLALFVALIFVSLERDSRKSWQRLAGRGSLFSLAAVSVLFGFNHLRTLVALPLSKEWRLALSRVIHLPVNSTLIGFLAANLSEGPVKTQYGVRDEFGVPSSAATWADPSMAWLAARETGVVKGTHLKVLVSTGNRVKRRPGISYMDLRSLTGG